MRAPAVTIAALALVASVGTGQAAAQEPASVPLAKKLVVLLEAQKLDAVAAQDPDEPDRFYAVLHVPGIQLLFVSARHAAPMYPAGRIVRHEYREAYADLNAASLAEGKVFIEDIFADGLHSTPSEGEAADVVYEEVVRRTKLNGDWKTQKMTEQEYRDKSSAVEAVYARGLSLLIAQLKPET